MFREIYWNFHPWKEKLFYCTSGHPGQKTLNPRIRPSWNLRRYKNLGFEIYAVGFSEDATAWANTIIFDQLDWKNVLERNLTDSPLFLAFNIKSIPTNFLITGRRNCARDLYGPELRIWLDNIINEVAALNNDKKSILSLMHIWTSSGRRKLKREKLLVNG